MFTMTDQLVEIERKHWQTLRDLYSPKSPETYVSYSLLDYYIRWPESVDIAFYSLNGDWSDGSFVAIWESQNDRNIVYLSSLDVPHGRLLRLLLSVDFTKGVHFRYVRDNALASVLEVIKLKNQKVVGQLYRIWYHLPQSQAFSFQITPPEGIVLKSIDQSDAHKIDEVHTLGLPGSLQTFRNMIKFNPSVGAFNSDGRMIAWALRWPFGGISALQVDDKYQRRGLGALIAKAISRKIAETGHDVCAGVASGNAAPQAIFEKLGFTRVPNLQWTDVDTLPAN